MRASKILALIALVVTTTFAQAGWKEFTFPDGNFRVVFPESPQKQMDAERNLHQFSANVGTESYGLAYADYSPNTDWESAVNGERDLILNGLGRVRGRREAYLSGRLSREMDPFCRTEYERGTRHLLRRAPAVFAARFCSEGCVSTGEFFYISKLVSTPLKAESIAGVERDS